jgi:hypothetical protein
MATGPEPHRDRSDQLLIHRAAAWLRDHPGQATHAGITSDSDARALAVVLDILADELPHLDADVRRQTVESCRVVLGEAVTEPRAKAH